MSGRDWGASCQNRNKSDINQNLCDLEDSLDGEWEVMSPRLRELFLNGDKSRKRVSLF